MSEETEGLTVVDEEWLEEYSESETSINLNTYTWIVGRCPTPPKDFIVQFGMHERGEKDAMVESIMALAINCAKKRFGLPIPREDIVQMAFEGACQAVKEWDPTRGVGLYAFAETVIMRFISKECRDDIEPMRIPDSQARIIVAVQNAYKILAYREVAPTFEEVYVTTQSIWKNTSNKLNRENVLLAIELMTNRYSPIETSTIRSGSEERPLSETLADESNDLAFYEEAADTSFALALFTAKQREVHNMLMEGKTYPDIGEELGISHQAARCRWENGVAKAKAALYCGVE